MGILTKSTKSRLEELESSKEDLEIKIANEKIAKPRISTDLYDDKMIITFNYKDSTKTITLDNVKRAIKKDNTGSDLEIFLFAREMGLERPLRNHAGGMFLARGRVPQNQDASGTDVD